LVAAERSEAALGQEVFFSHGSRFPGSFGCEASFVKREARGVDSSASPVSSAITRLLLYSSTTRRKGRISCLTPEAGLCIIRNETIGYHVETMCRLPVNDRSSRIEPSRSSRATGAPRNNTCAMGIPGSNLYARHPRRAKRTQFGLGESTSPLDSRDPRARKTHRQGHRPWRCHPSAPNKANFAVFKAENEGADEKQSQLARVSPGGAGRSREIRDPKLEIRKVSGGLRMSVEVINEANLWAGGLPLGIWDCGLGIRAGAEICKRTQSARLGTAD